MRGQGERTPDTSQGAEELKSQRSESVDDGSPSGVFDAERYNASMGRLFQIYSEISENADEVMKTRCPYKDARSRCTARFECRNQFFVKDPSQKPVCAGSDRVDYRSAWVDGGMVAE